MRLASSFAVALVIACSPARVETTEPPDDPAPTQAEPTETTSELDLSDEAVEPGDSVAAQPDRPPMGSFELCGDKCRDNVGLQRTLEADEGGDRE